MKNATKKSIPIKKQTYMNLLANKNLFILTIILAIILLALPILSRTALPGTDSYYNFRIANQFVQEGVSIHDSLMSNRLIIIGTPLLLYSLNYLTKINLFILAKYLPLLFGILTLLLFNSILKTFKLDQKTRNISSLILIISPPFLYLSTTLNNYFIPIFLTSLIFRLLLSDKKLFSFIFLLLIPFFGFLNLIAILSLVFIYILLKKRTLFKSFFLTLISTLIISLIYYFSNLKNIELLNFSTDPLWFHNLVSDFGGLFGIGIFSIILTFIGISYLWTKKYKNLVIYLPIIFLLVFSIYFNFSFLYLNLIIAPLAALGIIKLSELEWESRFIEKFTIFILVLGLLFSGISYLSYLDHIPPDNSIIESLKFLKADSSSEDVVFSHHSKGYWISSIAQRPVVMDELFYLTPNVNQKFKDSQELFYTRRLKNATAILSKYNITYIWAGRQMQQGLVWNEDDQGLLFLLESSKTFKNIYDQDGIKIWKVEQ